MVVSPPSAIKQALRFPDLVAKRPELRQPAVSRKKLLDPDHGQGTSISLQRLLGARDPKHVEPRGDQADGTSFNQFVATAVAEKLAAMNTAAFFLERRERADFAAFDKIMKRKGGERPMPEEVIPRR
jgi:hypothetical protein